MLNLNDKKKIAVVILLLIIILGSLVFIRGCDKKEFKDDLIPNTPGEVEPGDEEESSQSSDSTSDTTNTVVYQEVTSENQVIPNAPILDFEKNYQVEIGEVDFQLPTISEFDKDGNPLTIIITYYFKSIWENDFYLVDGISFNELGTYRIHYQVTDIYGQTTETDLMIEVVDQTAPTIEGFIEEYDDSSDLISYIPVNSGSITNQVVKLVFSDNDYVQYAEYYKAVYNIVNGENTIEEENLMQVIDIDLTKDFYLYEDGEYHIRAYDASGNYQEYIITIDRTNPVVEVTYEKIDSSNVLVTIKADEVLLPVSGFTLSEDGKTLTKIYDANTIEVITLEDLAGNQMELKIEVDNILTINVLQSLIPTTSAQLNRHDGDISISVTGSDNYTITYTINGGNSYTYTNGTVLTTDGDYHFTVTSGTEVKEISFYISSQGTSD